MKSTDWIDSIIATSAPPAGPWTVRLADLVLAWIERSHQRATLGRLDERLLADIGCDRASAAMESGKPFWRE